MFSDKYRIEQFDDDYITPEETFIDTLSNHAHLEVPISKTAFRTFSILIGLFLVIFLGQAFKLQVVKGEYFSVLADKNNSAKYTTFALRGIIYDRNGTPLVENIPALDLIAISSELPKQAEQLQKAFVEISSVIGIAPDELSDLYKANKSTSTFVLKPDLSKEEVLRINHINIPGAYVVARAQRNYINGPTFAHVLGYTAKVNAQDVEKDPYYYINDRVGRLGIESYYEDELRGDHANVLLSKTDNKAYETLKTGNNLVLTIDKDIQTQLHKALSSIMAGSGLTKGAAVVQDIETGAILGLVSMPTFDPNAFENSSTAFYGEKISQWLNDKNRPLFNRVVGGKYSPGSTIKPLYALAGLQEGTVTPKTLIYSDGDITVPSKYSASTVFTFRDWKAHGWTDIRKAIADSVDIYFYVMGGGLIGNPGIIAGNEDIKGMGIQKIVSYLKSFRADSQTGVDLPGEVAGFIPTEEWKQKTKGESWYTGDTYNISIGQGDLTVTPLWINSYIAALANQGKIMKPYIVKEIKDNEGRTQKSIEPQTISTISMQPDAIRIVKEGMRQTVLDGTATMLKDLPLAAKTGTAQVSGKNLNSLFTVYGPYDNPKLAMTVVIEHINDSQGLAVRVAKEFFTWYFSRE